MSTEAFNKPFFSGYFQLGPFSDFHALRSVLFPPKHCGTECFRLHDAFLPLKSEFVTLKNGAMNRWRLFQVFPGKPSS